uniref:Btz domain-containing protein n=1 Tax=Rhabditophanes sp. KR3021 TaxID=114890 RepID=A0AC35UES4_9BILA
MSVIEANQPETTSEAVVFSDDLIIPPTTEATSSIHIIKAIPNEKTKGENSYVNTSNIEEYNTLFANRYSVEDDEYKLNAERGIGAPHIQHNYYPRDNSFQNRRGSNDRRNWNRNDSRGRDNRPSWNRNDSRGGYHTNNSHNSSKDYRNDNNYDRKRHHQDDRHQDNYGKRNNNSRY